MININRRVQILTFFLNKELNLNDVVLKKGLNLVKFENNEYHFYDITENTNSKKSYACIFEDEMPFLMFLIFKSQTYYDVEESPTIPVHQHKKHLMAI